MQRYISTLLAALAIIFALYYSAKNFLYHSTEQKLSIPPSLSLEDGDIIFRKESNRISDIFSTINNSEYSHLGTIVLKNNEAFVVHIEDLDQEDDLQVVKINEFIKYATAYSIYRPLEKTKEGDLFKQVKKLQKENPQFDMSFGKNKTDNSIYCTELALFLYNNTHTKKISAKTEHYLNYEFIPLNTFYLSELLKPVYYYKDQESVFLP